MTSDEKEPQKYKGMKSHFKSATTETKAGETVEVPKYAFLIFDVSVENGDNQVFKKKRNGFRIVPLTTHVHFEKEIN